MSMSTYVKGLRDPGSEQHRKNLAAVEALENAGVDELPERLAKYFQTESWVPSASEVLHQPDAALTVEMGDAVVASKGDSSDIWTVDLRQLPDGVTHIKFVNSY